MDIREIYKELESDLREECYQMVADGGTDSRRSKFSIQHEAETKFGKAWYKLIKFVNEIINEIKARECIVISYTSANGEEFEKMLYEEKIQKNLQNWRKRYV